MGKEKILGVLIFIMALLVLVYYTWGLILIKLIGISVTAPAGWEWLITPNWEWLVILPIWAAAVLIMVIAMWIGWTMMTTPAPEPLEDFDFDEEKIEPEEKTE